ncbi:MAG: trypsin-like serine protease [Polyangiaceae bacterium]|jgi:hypothetical protein|nr:trypsin-like serine protease [Polyangiaceae bacterium]
MRSFAYRSAALCVATAGLPSCSAPTHAPTQDPVRQRVDPIVGGVADTSPENDAIVMLFNEKNSNICTGTLISRNVVLTARHCVSSTRREVTCGNDIVADYNPGDIDVLKGHNPKANPTLVGVGKQLFHDDSKSLCGHDIALILLKTKIYTIEPVRVRLATGPSVGELFRSVGYGVTDPKDESSAAQRYYRDGVRVLGYAPGTNNVDFVGTQSICLGDSGGPAISDRGAVMGVTSRGEDCYGDENVWTRTDRFKWLFDEATAAGGEPYAAEDATGGSIGGEPCGPDNECANGAQCVDDSGLHCRPQCSEHAPHCPAGFECVAGAWVCFQRKTCDVPEDCAPGTVCVGNGTGSCLPSCEGNLACPAGYTCATDSNICYPVPSDGSGISGGCAVRPGARAVTRMAGSLLLGLAAALAAHMRRRKPR